MEKLTKKEYEILELIRHSKSKSSIIMELKTMPNIINQYFSSIYKKTDFLVCYHSAKNKFEELQGYLRNNPTAFSVVSNESNEKDLKKIEQLEQQTKSLGDTVEILTKENTDLKKKIENKSKEKATTPPVETQKSENKVDIDLILDDLKIKYDMEKYNAHIKLQVLDEIKEKLNGKNGVNNKNGNK